MKHTLLRLLSTVGGALVVLAEQNGPYGLEDRSPNLTRHCEQCVQLTERVSGIIGEEDGDESDSNTTSSGASDTSLQPLNLKNAVGELALYNDLLSDLVPALKNPADGDVSRSAIELRERIDLESTPARRARLFTLSIITAFPSINKNLAMRLGEANLKRLERLSEVVERLPTKLPEVQTDSQSG